MSARMHLPRGLVTFLFTDIEGSTRLAQMLGTDYRGVLTEHRRLLRDALSSGNGLPLFAEGDSLFVAFPNAAAALEACTAGQRALAGHEWPTPQARPLVRMGLHTGYAEPANGEYASPEVHRAARIAAAAHGNQVLCSAATAQYAGDFDRDSWLLDLGLHRLRGFDARERLFQLVAPGLPDHFPRLRTEQTTAHNLPGTASSFVGRGTERRTLLDLLDAHRLVTAVGPGGAGKSRLALEAAGVLVEEYPDGVWYVDLATVSGPNMVATAVATALGLRPEPGRALPDTVADYAADRRFLLVLDTCEAQLPAAAALVGELLRGGRGARVLATSREPLGLPGEVVWRLPPLSLVPRPDGRPSDAVALMVDRAATARGGQPDAEGTDLPALGRIAERLAGLPLAIELAAARLRVLTPTELADRLDDVVDALDAGRPAPVAEPTGPSGPERRHASLHATIAWSYRTLRPEEARLLRWLSVFAGRVPLSTVEWLVDGDPLDELVALVDKSLVQAEPGGDGMTYRMLDPIRAFAARRLVEANEDGAAHNRHVAWVSHAVQAAYTGPDGRPVTLSLYSLDPLADELRAGLRWTASFGSARQGLRIAGALDQWWQERGLAREARGWLFRLYERLADTGEEVPPGELAAAYRQHAHHAGADGEHEERQRFLQRAEAAARRAGEPAPLARVLADRCLLARETESPDEAEQNCRDVILWAHEHLVLGDALFAVYALAEVLWQRGALDEAAELLAAARPVEAGRPAERGRRTIDMMLGMVALVRGDLVAAHDHLVVALRSRIGYGFGARACATVHAFAVRCALGGDLETAARLFGAVQAANVGLRRGTDVYDAYFGEQESTARAVLGDAEFDAAYAAGGHLTLDEAATVALSVEHPDLAVGSGRFGDVDSRAS